MMKTLTLLTIYAVLFLDISLGLANTPLRVYYNNDFIMETEGKS